MAAFLSSLSVPPDYLDRMAAAGDGGTAMPRPSQRAIRRLENGGSLLPWPSQGRISLYVLVVRRIFADCIDVTQHGLYANIPNRKIDLRDAPNSTK